MSLRYLFFALAIFQGATVGAPGTVFETRITTLVISTAYDWAPPNNFFGNSINIRHAQDQTNSPVTLSPTTPAEKPLNACPACSDLFTAVEVCYNLVTENINLIELQSQAYQRCFCFDSHPYDDPGKAFPVCQACLKKTILDPSLLDAFSSNVNGFCRTKMPSLFLFLYRDLDFLYRAHAPSDYPVLKSPIKIITILAHGFTSTPGMNELPSSTTSQSATLFPTAYLSQLPPNWPYTAYGLVRRPNQSTTFRLTNSSDGQPAAIVVALLQWYPRPLGSQQPLINPQQSVVRTTTISSESSWTPRHVFELSTTRVTRTVVKSKVTAPSTILLGQT